MIRKEYLTVPLSALVPYANNPRINDGAVAAVIASMQQCENLDPIEVDEDFVILSGHTRLKALQQLGYETTGVLKISGLTEEQKRKYRLLANKTNEAAAWDFDKLAVELDGLDFDGIDFGFDLDGYEVDDFDQNMRDGEARQERTEEYEEFEKKFELKKTTDDCYTPALVYDALAGWVAEHYGLKEENFVRPFYPGGDYQARIYGPDDVVVDNPPFSILSEICRYYIENGIRFFLFAPTLTLFSSIVTRCTALPLGVAVTYENGANVTTSFLTNLEPGVQLRSAPDLYQVIKEANEKARSEGRVELPSYEYPDYVATATRIAQFSRYGVEFSVPSDECQHIRQLDAQAEYGKAIFGSGFLLSERMKAEKEKAEKEKAEKEKAEKEKVEKEVVLRWELSDRERAVVRSLERQQ